MVSALKTLGQLASATLAAATGPTLVQYASDDITLEPATDMVVSQGGSAVVVTLPPLVQFNASGPLRNTGKSYIFKRSGAGPLTVAPSGSDLVDGEASLTVDAELTVAVVESPSGLQWTVTSASAPATAEIRIRSQADFGEPVGGVITVADGTYYLGEDVPLDDGVRLVVDATASGRVALRADGPHVQLIGNVDGAALVTLPNQGVISHISIINEGAGDVVEVSARTSTTIDAAANFAFLYDCNLASPSDFSSSTALLRVRGDDDGREPPRVKINNCNIGSFASEASIVAQDGTVDFIDISNTLLPAPLAPSILLASNFDGFNFGASIIGGTLGAVPGSPAITVAAGATIVNPASTRPFLIESVNIAGTLSGFDVAHPDVLFVGNQGVRDSLFVGAASFSGNSTTTTFSTSGTYTPILGTLVEDAEQQRWTLSGDEFTYDGTETRDLLVRWSASVEAASGAHVCAIRVERRPDGGSFSQINGIMETEASNRVTSFSGLASMAVAPGDTIRLGIANLETTTSITVVSLQIRMDAM